MAVHVSIFHFRYEQLEVKDNIFFTIVSATPFPGTNKGGTQYLFLNKWMNIGMNLFISQMSTYQILSKPETDEW